MEIELGKTVYYFGPTWSPDSKKIAFSDAHFNLYYVDVQTKKVVHVDTNNNGSIPSGNSNVFVSVWSPDSKWISYLKLQENGFDAVYLYSLESGKSTPVTDGMGDAGNPTFSADGKYLFFPGSTNSGLGLSGLHMQTYGRQAAFNVYAVMLDKTRPPSLRLRAMKKP